LLNEGIVDVFFEPFMKKKMYDYPQNNIKGCYDKKSNIDRTQNFSNPESQSQIEKNHKRSNENKHYGMRYK
jgi:hypothetical protein